MKKTTILALCAQLLALLWASTAALAEPSPELRGIRFESVSPGSDKVVLQLNGSYSPNIFTIKDETPRLVLDFANMNYTDKVKHAATVAGSIVKRIRVGMHTDNGQKTRVVLDLATLKGVSYEKELDEKSSTLTLRISKSATAKAKAETKQPTEEHKGKAIAPQTGAPTQDSAIASAKTKSQDGQQAAAASAAMPAGPAKTDQAGPETTVADTTQEGANKEPDPVKPPAGTPPDGSGPAATMTTQQPSGPAATPTDAGQPAGAKVEDRKAETAQTTAGTAPKEKAAQPPQAKAEEINTVAKPAETAPAADAKPAEQAAAVKQETEAAKSETPSAAATVATGQAEAAKQEEPKTDAAQTVAAAPSDQSSGQPTPVPPSEQKAADEKKPAAPTGPMIESVRFDGKSPKGEMVLFKLNEFHPPSVHGVEEGIPRVICDFKNTQLAEPTDNLIKTDGKYVKVIRISKSKKPDKVRVVLDLAPNKSYDLQQVFFKEENLFVLIVNTVKS